MRGALADRRKRQLAWLMELSLVGFLFVGVDRGNVGIVVNSAVALAVTQLPMVLERDYDITMSPGLVLWLTAAVFLHALGTLGPYRDIWWWDHVTHALSSSLVGGAGYGFARAVDRHIPDVNFPPSFTFAFLVLVVLAFGVLWEVLEFGVTAASTAVTGTPVLTQYGVDDTMLDLVFDIAGGVLVGLFGTAYVAGFTDRVLAVVLDRA